MELTDIRGRYKKINGFEDYYITEYGEVYSERLRGARKHHHLRKLEPKWPRRKCGYGNVILCRDDEQRTCMIHRLVAEHFVDGYFEGAVVNHIDGNTHNNVYTNLEWVTVAENIRKSYKTSGVSAKRNYRLFYLIDPDGALIGMFEGFGDIKKYIAEHNLPASPSGLERNGQSKGYKTIKSVARVKNCNDYPQGVAGG